MKSNLSALPSQQRKGKDYLAAKEAWLKHTLSLRRLTTRAKLVATAMFFDFNQDRFTKSGLLYAWRSLRSLDKATGQDRKTVVLAIEDLESAGLLKAHRRYDKERGRYRSHLYLALMPKPKSSKKVFEKPKGGWFTRVDQGGPDGSTRVVQTGGPDSMTDSMKDSMNKGFAPASRDALTLENYKRRKEEFEGRLSPPKNAEPSIEFPLGECSREIGDAARGDGDAAAQRLSDDR